uniref:Uncharacterized protein n=1 Tax=Acrobeloides nanus TaxID=290746 RepID=A0A914C8J4_9BILA
MGNLLLFYYIEAHTDRMVASAFAIALYVNWIEKYQHKQNNKDIFVVNIPKVPLRKSKMFFQPEPNDIGWNLSSEKPNQVFPKPDTKLPKTRNIGWISGSTKEVHECKQSIPESPESISSGSSSDSTETPPDSESPSSVGTGFSSDSTSKLTDTPTSARTPFSRGSSPVTNSMNSWLRCACFTDFKLVTIVENK